MMKHIRFFITHERISLLFFLLYFLVGVLLLTDYGVAWDEFYQEGIGQTNLQYILKKNDFLVSPSYADKYFGPAYELLIAGTRRVVALVDKNFTDMGQAFTLHRHMVNFFTFFVGVIFFYLLCRHRFKNAYFGLLGALFLILTPRLFADAYYNSKDTVFLAFFVMCFYALVKFLEKKTLSRLVILAVITGVSCSIRVASLLIPLFAVTAIAFDWFMSHVSKAEMKKDGLFLIIYGVVTGGVIYGTYPVLWINPVQNFIYILQLFSRFTLDVHNLYFGQYVSALHLPWHFIPMWILITTPFLYLGLFSIGLLFLGQELKLGVRGFYKRHKEDVLFLLWFFFPLGFVVIMRSANFNGWRHMYFIYPALLLIALYGLQESQKFLKKFLPRSPVVIWNSAMLLGVLIYIGTVMATLHPYEHVYFNFLAGRRMDRIRDNFDMDYWGLSYRKGLEYILANDKRGRIIIDAETYPAWANSWILSEQDRNRLIFIWPWDKNNPKADYYMTTFFHSRREPDYKEVYSVRARGAKIMSVYKIP